MIRDAFSPDPRNEHLDAYLSSTTSTVVTRYNAHLADFRGQLRKHISFVDGEITKTQALQAKRHAGKMMGAKQRLASFWSLEAVRSPCPAGPQSANNNQGGGENELDGKGQMCGGKDEKVNAKQERIARLRQEGWRVTKEKHGFRGVEFYDRLTWDVEMELALA